MFYNAVLSAIGSFTELHHQIMLVIFIKIVVSLHPYILSVVLAVIAIAVIIAHDLLAHLQLHMCELDWFWLLMMTMREGDVLWIWVGLCHWLE